MVIKNLTIPLLSFVCPGLSHIYLGYKKKALSLAIVFGIVLTTFLLTHQLIIQLLMFLAYIALAFPAAIETGLELNVGKRDALGQSKLYLAVLLLMTGMAALPLLWQGKAYRLKGKIVWTVTVIILAVLFFFVLGHYMNSIESVIESRLSK